MHGALKGHDVVESEEAWRAQVKAFGGWGFVVDIVQRSFGIILDIYNRGEVMAQNKPNGSPVSEADLASAAFIERELAATGIPVVCEESVTCASVPGPLFWLVDPLDGTKEFLARNGEFTVNVALVAGDEPVLGVIGIPVTGEVYFAVRGAGAFRVDRGGVVKIENQRSSKALIAAVSRSHRAHDDDASLQKLGVVETIASGSAIKFCRIAEGSADIYVRFGRTMEWDTAAGQCILLESGGKVLMASNGEVLRYGKVDFANPSFIACRADLPWIPVQDQSDDSRRVGNL
jgi:3'(2'), 5'-bisphosphate nucleotidase